MRRKHFIFSQNYMKLRVWRAQNQDCILYTVGGRMGGGECSMVKELCSCSEGDKSSNLAGEKRCAWCVSDLQA